MNQLQFDVLLGGTLKEWPEIVDLEMLEDADVNFDRYTVKGLWTLAESIEARCIGEKDEIIRGELLCALYTVILEAAKYVTSVRIDSIRTETVRMVFERRLKIAVETKDAGWQEDDLSLVRKYFEANT